MGKYLVTSAFIDRFTRVLYKKGQVYETNDTKRIEELRTGGFLGEEVAPPTKAKEKPAKKETTKDANQ
ncbi:hypothetical protein H1164_13230 [Thermoactinomyces daqus]|uniref:Uncharacterized protein n=1 Tax=Thermoactinomyces daqus TaxID=1329516 RepID=A0A7W1XC17_9BACL|nr:hypothetical protein [Thermoactinomyces daqus]MBA4543851.1 hypothetical protein [Thermoactinomyces daqus]